ncbi:alpha-1,3-mannosyl-glycoprotein 4-beta-N-acetylglucosaminyltransferase C-like [Acropora muricata]|uniref:alpha-1,3-mannosyl-glycoprotein 4-beta-N-acetylglucosaminyltransferase C-like n=1 Tax=Acropora muricata TaxID=159855 RepID=UPI0034E47B7A
MASEIEELLFSEIRTRAEMGKQRFIYLALCGIILYNAASLMKNIFKDSLHSCRTSSSNVGSPVADCSSESLSTRCKGLFDDEEVKRGLILGGKSNNEVFLSVGIMTSGDHEVDNLIQAVRSLKANMAVAEYTEVVLVPVIERGSSEATIKQLEKDFGSDIDSGLVQVISPTNVFLEKAHSMIEPSGWEDVSFTNKFKQKMYYYNIRLAFLLRYCFHISKNFLLLTDQARAVKPYLSIIKSVVGDFENQKLSSYAHDFGAYALPGLGRLYPKKVIGDLTEFGVLFAYGPLPSQLLDSYHLLKATLKGSRQTLETTLFDMTTELRGSKPITEVKTAIDFARGHEFEKAFYYKESFAWLQVPKADQSLDIVLKDPLPISRVRIATGSPLYIDILGNSMVLACGNVQETDTCHDSICAEIGDFRDPIMDVNVPEKILDFPVKCLRIIFTADVKHWVIIREISIWLRETKK